MLTDERAWQLACERMCAPDVDMMHMIYPWEDALHDPLAGTRANGSNILFTR